MCLGSTSNAALGNGAHDLKLMGLGEKFGLRRGLHGLKATVVPGCTKLNRLVASAQVLGNKLTDVDFELVWGVRPPRALAG